MLVALHPVRDAFLDHTRADALEEHPPVRDRPVRLPVEDANVGTRCVVDVQQGFVGREAETIRLLEVVDEQLGIAAFGRDPVNALEAELALALDPEDRHTSVPRVAEVDGPVVRDDHVIRTVQLLALVVRCEGLAIAPRTVRIHAHEGARDVLAHEQPAPGVVGHPVALVARVGDLGDPVFLAPAPPNVGGHVAEEQIAPLLVPDRSLCEGEARRELLDLRLRVNELMELLRLDVNGHLGSFARGVKPVEPNTFVFRAKAALSRGFGYGACRAERARAEPVRFFWGGGWAAVRCPRAVAPAASPPAWVRPPLSPAAPGLSSGPRCLPVNARLAGPPRPQ